MRWWKWVLLILLLFCGAFYFALDPLLEKALREVAARVEASGQRITFEDLDVGLLDGNLRLQGLAMMPVDTPAEADSASFFLLHADVVDLEGVEIWKLLREKVLIVHAFVVHAPSMEHSFVTRKGPRPEKKKKEKKAGPPAALPTIRIDSLLISHASMSSIDRAGVRPSVSVAGMDLLVMHASLEADEDNKPVLDRSEVRLDLRGISADLPPLYKFTIDSLKARYPETATRIFGMNLTSTVGPKEYHTKVEHLVDLMGVHADSLVLSGFSLVEQIQNGAYRADKVELFGAVFEIHHDKSIPEAPGKRKRKPLPSEAIRAMPVTLGIDTLRTKGCEVRYSERMKRGDDYGTIAFTDIDAVLTGMSNAPDSTPADLHVQGTARVSGKGRASLDIRMPMGAVEPEIEIRARVEDLQASILNRMTDNLMQVNATAGHIHRVDMHMKGGDERASGTMDMQYENLHMELNSTVEHAGLLSKVANMAVRTNNMPGEKGFREGHFSIERKQDRSVFNYLWLGVKAGCMDVVLPNSLKTGIKEYSKMSKKGKKEKKKGKQ